MEWPDHIWDMGRNFWEGLPVAIDRNSEIICELSRPSIVEKSLRTDFFVALAAYAMKAPWFLFHNWPYVGGWECVYRKIKVADQK